MRNRKKQLLAAFVLTLTLCLCLAAPALAAEEDTIVSYAVTGGNIYFDPATGEITDCDRSVTAAEIPGTIDGVAVTGIGVDAFYYCTSLTSVTLPDGVTGIGSSAFSYCTSLASIDIPASVMSISSSAFSDCTNLTSITVDDANSNYSDVGGVLFSKDQSTIIFYPIGKADSSYTIPNSVKSIGWGAFESCTNLTSIDIPASVTSIGDSAFWGCTSLTSIDIPDSVTSIGGLAFYRCTSLTSIVIPGSVTSIGKHTFQNCTSLTNITVDEENLNYCDVDGVLFDKNQSTIICYPAGKTGLSYIIPYSVKSIGDSAFSYCTNLKSIIIPNSVTSIDAFAFDNCTGLISITIPDSATSIGDSAFFRCIGLTSIVIPASVTNINGWAFYLCSNLTSITIPNSVEIIGNGMFEDCTSLKNIVIPDSVTSIGAWAFDNCSALTDVYYGGTEIEWTTISIDSYNDSLLSATIHYNSAGPEETPTLSAVIFNPQGGGLPTGSSVEVSEDGTLTTIPVPTLSGSLFTGWVTEDGTQVTTKTLFADGDTVTARWTPLEKLSTGVKGDWNTLVTLYGRVAQLQNLLVSMPDNLSAYLDSQKETLAGVLKNSVVRAVAARYAEEYGLDNEDALALKNELEAATSGKSWTAEYILDHIEDGTLPGLVETAAAEAFAA